jgi:SAM-dependent methyltransferase
MGAAEAAVEESVVVPQWKSLFGKLMLDRIEPGFRGRTLDAAAGTGHLSLEILRQMGDVGRVVAIESDAGLLEVLRRRASTFAGTRFFARAESPDALSFGDEVFDIAVACSGTSVPWLDPRVLSELRRVVVPGGRVLLGLPLHGTFEEVLDMFRDVATRLGDAHFEARIEALAARDPHPDQAAYAMQAAGFREATCSAEERQLSFRSVPEFFAHPLIRAIALPDWRTLCGFDRESAELLVEVERTFATYMPKGPITLRVRLGVIDAVRA